MTMFGPAVLEMTRSIFVSKTVPSKRGVSPRELAMRALMFCIGCDVNSSSHT